MECELCIKQFDDANHRPLVLIPCGHSFCASCVTQLTVCPSDRSRITSKVANWSILKLISQTENKQIKQVRLNLSQLKELANEKGDENEGDLVRISVNKSAIEKIEEKLKNSLNVDENFIKMTNEKIGLFNFNLIRLFNKENSKSNFLQLIKEVKIDLTPECRAFTQKVNQYMLIDHPYISAIVENINLEDKAFQNRVYGLLKSKFSAHLADLLYQNSKISNWPDAFHSKTLLYQNTKAFRRLKFVGLGPQIGNEAICFECINGPNNEVNPKIAFMIIFRESHYNRWETEVDRQRRERF